MWISTSCRANAKWRPISAPRWLVPAATCRVRAFYPPERAFHLHGGYSDRILQDGDIVQLETTPNSHHYHARFMRPIKVTEATDEDHRIVESLIRIQDSAIAEVGPGVPATVPDAVYREGVLSAGPVSYTHLTLPTKA